MQIDILVALGIFCTFFFLLDEVQTKMRSTEIFLGKINKKKMMLRIKLYKETYISTVTIAWQRERVTGARKIRSPVSNLKKNDRDQVLGEGSHVAQEGVQWRVLVSRNRVGTNVSERIQGRCTQTCQFADRGSAFSPFSAQIKLSWTKESAV